MLMMTAFTANSPAILRKEAAAHPSSVVRHARESYKASWFDSALTPNPEFLTSAFQSREVYTLLTKQKELSNPSALWNGNGVLCLHRNPDFKCLKAPAAWS